MSKLADQVDSRPGAGIDPGLWAKRPNLFIVGAPKCGTTSLHAYLDQHPAIFMSALKEPFHFCPDLEIPGAIDEGRQYLELFRDALREKWRGESSTMYLYSRESARLIKEFNPDARIIILLRNPVDMVGSLHIQHLKSGFEEITDIEEALAAAPDRMRGERLPPCSLGPKNYDYIAMATTSPQVKRYFDRFDRERIHVIVYDDLKGDPAGVYRRTLEFLGVDPTFEADLTVHNSARPVTSIDLVLKPFLLRHARRMSRVVSWLTHRRSAVALYRRAVTTLGKVESRPGLAPALRARLTDHFRPEVMRLSELIGRDLTHWSWVD